MKDIILEWYGPLNILDFINDKTLSDKFQKPGIYLWNDDVIQNCITYIGKASGKPTLKKRMVEHYLNFVSARYTIPGKYRSSGVEWNLDLNSKVIMESLGQIGKLKGLVEEAYHYATNIELYLAPTDTNEGLDEIERSLIYHFQPTRNKRHKQKVPNVKLNIEHIGALEMKENMLAKRSMGSAMLTSD